MTSGQAPRMAMLFVALALASAPALAQIYKYRDASGRMVVSDKPPPGKSQLKEMTVGAETADTPKAPPVTDDRPKVDPKLEARRREQEAREKAEQEERDREQKEERRAACGELRGYLAALENGERIARRLEDGGREYLTDEQRDAEILRAKKQMAKCN